MRVAVIGGGIAGCSAAWHLTRRGDQAVVFERADALGGRARTWRDGAMMLDTGAGFFTNFYPELHGVIDALGLRGDVVPLERTSGFLCDGEMATMTLGSVASFLRFPFLGARDKVRFAAEMAKYTLMRRRLDLFDPHVLAAWDDGRTMGEAVREELGEVIYHQGIRPGVEPFWYFSCDEASVAMLIALCSRAVDGSIAALRGGMDTLCPALAADASVRLNETVVPLQVGDAGVVVNGDAFDAAVVATPAGVCVGLTELLRDDVINEEQRSFLCGLRYVPQIHVGFLVPEKAWPQECSVLVPSGAGSFAVGCMSLHSPKHGRPRPGYELISVYLTASASGALLDADPDDVAAEAWAQARNLWPRFPAEAECVGVWPRREAIPVPTPGHYRRASAFLKSMRPPVVFAGDHLTTPTLEGALRTGRWAVEALSGA